MRRIPTFPARCLLLSVVLTARPADLLAAGPTFTRAGGIQGPGYTIDSAGNATFTTLNPGLLGALPALASGGRIDTTGNLISGGTPSAAPTSHTLTLSCLPNGFPGGAANVRNHAQVCIQGVANKYSNNGIYVNGAPQTGPSAYNDNDYMVTLGLDVQPGSNNAVGLYDIVQGEAGASSFWAVNTVTQLQPGFTNSAAGYELDFNNNSGSAANSNYGFWATGASQYPNYAAYYATGVSKSQWHFGYVSTSGVDTADFLSTSAAADSLNVLGAHPGSGLKLKAGLFGTSAIDLATDPTNSVPQTVRWSDQNGGGYGTFSVGVDRLTAPDRSTSLAFNAPLGAMTLRYDGSLTLGTTTAGGGALNVPGTVNVGGRLTAGGLNTLGDFAIADTHSITFLTNTATPCYFFHDDAAAGLVYVCGSVRLMRIPDNGSAPIFKTAPVAGTP